MKSIKKSIQLTFILVTILGLSFSSCSENEKSLFSDQEDIKTKSQAEINDDVYVINSIEEFNELIVAFSDIPTIGEQVKSNISPLGSIVEKTYTGYYGDQLLRENIITRFDFITANRLGVSANVDYYVNFYSIGASVSDTRALGYMIRDSPECGIKPNNNEFGTVYGYDARSVGKGFSMFTTLVLIKNKVGDKTPVNKWYPRAPVNLKWNYAMFYN